jgi:hypothetical protein
MGYPGARLFVDESLRTAPRSERPVDTPHDLGVLLLGAPDRLSLVFELQSEPRQVTSARPDAATLQIDAGPMPAPAQPQQWSAPDGVHLLHTVSVDAVAAQGGLNYVRARVALPEFAKANVRTEGRRVYVDLTWPLEEEQDPRTPRRATVSAPQEENSSVPARQHEPGSSGQKQNSPAQQERYREEILPIHQRINEIRPFILSAAQSGSTDVYAALDSTLANLEASLVAMSVPPSEAGQHQLLIAATRSARSGLEPGFSGDRLAHAQKALTMFDGAMAAPVISTAP